MKILLLVMGVVVAALNLLIWHSKRSGGKPAADEPAKPKDTLDTPLADSSKFLNSAQAKPLKQSAASELGISVEQLDRMSVKEIKQLATEKGLF